MTELPRLYRELSDWWPLLSAPEDYAEEAGVYVSALRNAASIPVQTVLELGSGGGNNASHMKSEFDLTLVDLSPGMLEVSGRLNPECEHIQGDMRSVRLGRRFDAVFVHDAVSYLTELADVGAVVATARAHCRDGGSVVIVPDAVSETFVPATSHGGHDGLDRSLRYLEWRWDPDPNDTTYRSDMVYLLRRGEDTEAVHDRHVLGLFRTQDWLETMGAAGFDPRFDIVTLGGGEGVHVFSGSVPGGPAGPPG